MTLEDEPAAEPTGPGTSGPAGDRPSAGDLPAGLPGDLPAGLPGDLSAGLSGDLLAWLSGDLSAGLSGDLPAGLSGDLTGDLADGFPVPPRNATSRADKRRNQRRR